MRKKASGLLLIMLSAALAGCADEVPEVQDDPDVGAKLDELSAKIYDILPVEELWITADDGKRLNHAVYRPDTNKTVPVFINFSPYWGDTALDGGDNFAKYMVNEYVPRGYAVVLASVRGTGHSEGCFSIGGDRESMDVYQVVDHFANQPWSNGMIAAGGKSYDSTSQNGMIAKFPHEALKGIFHVSGITDMYRYNYREGVAYGNGLAFTPRYYVTQGFDEYLGVTNGAGSASNEDAESLARLVDDVACVELPEHVISGEGSAAHGMKDEYWIERDWNRYIEDSAFNGSVFFVHGFQDWNVKPDHILPFLDLLPNGTKVKAWLHQDTYGNGHVYPMRDDWNHTMLAWMDSELKGKNTGIWDTPAYELEGSDGLWRNATQWPPATTDVEPQGTVLMTAGDNETLRYSGQASITVTVTPTIEDPVLSVVLHKQDDRGQQTWMNAAVLRVLYRDGLEQPSPITPGSPIEVTAEFYPQDDILGPGESWVLEFGGAPGKGLVVTQAQLDGLSYDIDGAVVHLPLVDAAVDEDNQPVATECFAC